MAKFWYDWENLELKTYDLSSPEETPDGFVVPPGFDTSYFSVTVELDDQGYGRRLSYGSSSSNRFLAVDAATDAIEVEWAFLYSIDWRTSTSTGPTPAIHVQDSSNLYELQYFWDTDVAAQIWVRKNGVASVLAEEGATEKLQGAPYDPKFWVVFRRKGSYLSGWFYNETGSELLAEIHSDDLHDVLPELGYTGIYNTGNPLLLSVYRASLATNGDRVDLPWGEHTAEFSSGPKPTPEPSEPELTHDVEYGPVGGAKTLVTGVDVKGYKLTGLQAETLYEVRVRNVHIATGTLGDWSAWGQFETLEAVEAGPTTPTNLTTTDITANSFRAGWTP